MLTMWTPSCYLMATAAPGCAALAIAKKDGLLRAGVRGFADDVFLVGGNVFGDRRRVAFDVVELEGLRRDHRAQRVPLAAI